MSTIIQKNKGGSMNIGRDFIKILSGFDLLSYEQSGNIVYAIDDQFILQYFNQQWESFAKENNSSDIIFSSNIGCNILTNITGPLRHFYYKKYNDVLNSRTIFEHEFECSSPEKYRKYHQRVIPLPLTSGLLITNSKIQEYPHLQSIQHHHSSNLLPYLNSDGEICQCSNCRKVKNMDYENRWDWIAKFIVSLQPNTIFSVCDECMNKYYNDIDLYN